MRAGYVESDGKYKQTSLGIPLGGSASPLLSNIYLHEFDMFMLNLKEEFERLPLSVVHPDYAKKEVKIRTARS